MSTGSAAGLEWIGGRSELIEEVPRTGSQDAPGRTWGVRYGIVPEVVSPRRTDSPLLAPGLVLLLLGLAGCGAREESVPSGATPSRPNIVLVVSDDQDNTHFGFAGHPLAHTPNLDRLVDEGCLFSTMHTPPRCRPSLAVLLSGRHPHQSGIYANRHRRVLSPEGSLPNRLRAAGYATFAGGKYWEGDVQAMGFDAPAEPSPHFARSGQEELFSFLDENAGEKPVFVWWAPALPHTPHDPPQRYLDLIDGERIEVPPHLPHASPVHFRRFEELSLAMGAWFDDELGKLVEAFRTRGLYENTLFLFLIDNGWTNGLVAKGSPFEKGVSTPFVAVWPGLIPGGARRDQRVESLDVMPTILEAAGLDVPDDLAGESLLPGLRGEPFDGREVLYAAVYGRAAVGDERPEKDAYALYARDARWKYVLYLQPVDETIWSTMIVTPQRDMNRLEGEEDLYDLETDPMELRDLSLDPAHRPRMDRMRAGALAWWRATGGGELR